MPTGGQCSHVAVKESRIIPIPDEMGHDDEAAAMPVTYLTAHHMLRTGHLKKGGHCIDSRWGKVVGAAALQLCQWAGIEAGVGRQASGHKADIIKSFGGIPIDRHNQDFTKIVKEATDGRGVDHILDPIGGRQSSKESRLSCRGR